MQTNRWAQSGATETTTTTTSRWGEQKIRLMRWQAIEREMERLELVGRSILWPCSIGVLFGEARPHCNMTARPQDATRPRIQDENPRWATEEESARQRYPGATSGNVATDCEPLE